MRKGTYEAIFTMLEEPLCLFAFILSYEIGGVALAEQRCDVGLADSWRYLSLKAYREIMLSHLSSIYILRHSGHMEC